MANLFIISGCNGAGKTTASYTILPEILNCKEFVNADEIARGLSPFQPEMVAIEAGRIMLHRLQTLIDSQADFAFETTLATKSYRNFVLEAQRKGYFVTLIYFWLNTPELAINRVNARVESGGHNIPEDVIRRRYTNGIHNLFDLFIPIADYWMIVDNSDTPFHVIAEGFKDSDITIKNQENFDKIKMI